MKYLFIGGPKDAELLEVEHDKQYHQVAEPVTRMPSPETISIEAPAATLHLYRRILLQNGADKTVTVFLISSEEEHTVIERLIDGYHADRAEAKRLMRVCYDEANRIANHCSDGAARWAMKNLYEAANEARKIVGYDR